MKERNSASSATAGSQPQIATHPRSIFRRVKNAMNLSNFGESEATTELYFAVQSHRSSSCSCRPGSIVHRPIGFHCSDGQSALNDASENLERFIEITDWSCRLGLFNWLCSCLTGRKLTAGLWTTQIVRRLQNGLRRT